VATTLMSNGARSTDVLPSLTLMRISANVRPASAGVGVPLSSPFDALNVAHAGAPEIVNVNASPSASFAAGLNEYRCPCMAVVAGAPEMVGARLDTAPLLGALSGEDAERCGAAAVPSSPPHAETAAARHAAV